MQVSLCSRLWLFDWQFIIVVGLIEDGPGDGGAVCEMVRLVPVLYTSVHG